MCRGCKTEMLVSKRAAEVPRIKAVQGISYAEAVKKVSGGTQVPRQKITLKAKTQENVKDAIN